MNITSPFNSYIITQGFGENPGSYSLFGYPGHNGIDLWTNEDPAFVLCVCAGQVEKVGWEAGGYGKYVVVVHFLDANFAISWRSYYAHLKSVNVKPGQLIRAGQFIGEMGSTGNTTGPHLHLGIRFPVSFNPTYKGFLDPYPYLQETALPLAPLVNPPYTPMPGGAVGGVLYGKSEKQTYKLPGVKLIGTWKNKTLYRMKRFF